MTTRRTVATAVTAVLILALCLVTGALLGTGVAAGFGAAALVIVLASSTTAVRPQWVAEAVHRSRGRRTTPAPAFPRYQQLERMLGQGLRDRRYFDRVVAPLLRGIAVDLIEPPADPTAEADALRERLGDEITRLVDPTRPHENANSGRPEDARLVAELLDRIEPLERSWT